MKEESKCKAGVLRDESWRAGDQLEQRVARDAKSGRKGVCKCFNSTLEGKCVWIVGWGDSLTEGDYGKG